MQSISLLNSALNAKLAMCLFQKKKKSQINHDTIRNSLGLWLQLFFTKLNFSTVTYKLSLGPWWNILQNHYPPQLFEALPIQGATSIENGAVVEKEKISLGHLSGWYRFQWRHFRPLNTHFIKSALVLVRYKTWLLQ